MLCNSSLGCVNGWVPQISPSACFGMLYRLTCGRLAQPRLESYERRFKTQNHPYFLLSSFSHGRGRGAGVVWEVGASMTAGNPAAETIARRALGYFLDRTGAHNPAVLLLSPPSCSPGGETIGTLMVFWTVV